MTKDNQISNLRGLYIRVRSKIADALASSKLYTDSRISQIETFSQEVVQSLDDVTSPKSKTLYFVLSSNSEQGNVYDEFIYTANGWEQVGSTAYTPDHNVDTTTLSGKVVITQDGHSFAIAAEEIVKPDVPTITAGSDFFNSKTITMSAASGAVIRYAMTTNGDTPTTPTASTGNEYAEAFNIGNTDTYQTTYKIVAVAIKNGMVSDPTEVQTYVCTRRVDAPSISIGGNKYASSRIVTLTQEAADSIMYRIGDSGDFSTYDSSNKPSVTISGVKVYAYSVKSGWADSANAVSDAVTLNARKCYIGQAASLADNAAVEALANSYERDTLVGFTAPTIDFGSTTEYVWFAIPNTAARNLTVKSSGYGVTLNDAAGSIVGSYRVWRTANKINSSFTFEIS